MIIAVNVNFVKKVLSSIALVHQKKPARRNFAARETKITVSCSGSKHSVTSSALEITSNFPIRNKRKNDTRNFIVKMFYRFCQLTLFEIYLFKLQLRTELIDKGCSD